MLVDPGGGGGFRLDPDVLFEAAVQMAGTEDYMYGIEGAGC